MEAKRRLSSIYDEEDGGEEREEDLLFYERIEAPKFVDLTLPDPYRANDDRYWFCQRVGCDQSHEQDMDSETIYRNFLLRVMAARSPNVMLRKALNKRAISKNCPASAPPRPSKSRIPRLALVPAISRKKIDSMIVRPRPLSTPKARVKHVAAKYMMTTPRGRRGSGNPKPFQSVRDPEKKRVLQKNDHVVAKALVFNSPRKPGKPKAASAEEDTPPISTLCKKMRKVEMKGKSEDDDAHKRNQSIHHEEMSDDCHLSETRRNGSSSDSLASLKPKTDEACGGDNEDADMVETSRNITSMVSQEEATSSTDSPLEDGDSIARSSGDVKSSRLKPLTNSGEKVSTAATVSESEDLNGGGHSFVETETAENVESDFSKEERPLDPCIQERQSSGEGRDGEYVDMADKENAVIRDLNVIRHQTGKDTSSKHDKVLKVIQTAGAIMKENCTTGVCKYRKPKVTNPKPFKLRTYERGILKEATMEKKLNHNEAGATHQWNNSTQVNTNFSVYSRSGINSAMKKDLQERYAKDKLLHTRIMQQKDPKQGVDTKPGALNQKKATVPAQQKPARLELKGKRDGYVAHALKEKSTMSGSSALQKEPVRPHGRVSTLVKLGGPSEAMGGKPSHGVSSPADKVPEAQRSASKVRRPLTIPKEPSFHSMHLPKSCCTRSARAR
ncbi:hypothetical protein Dimus_026319 [Dionaea muscipula]